MILPPKPPPPLQQFLNTLSWFLDRRHSELFEHLFVGMLLSHGRRTATAWFRAAAIADDFRRAYTLIGTIGRSKCDSCATVLFSQLSRTIDPGPPWPCPCSPTCTSARWTSPRSTPTADRTSRPSWSGRPDTWTGSPSNCRA